MTMRLNGQVITDSDVLRLASAQDYFRAMGEDPELISTEFWMKALALDRTPSEMFADATNGSKRRIA